MKLILGSQSGGRKLVMNELGLNFVTMGADIDEKAIRTDIVQDLPLLIARAKSHALRRKINEPAILITADTVVMQNGELHEKPSSIDQARKWLKSFHESPLSVVSAMVVFNTQTKVMVEEKFQSKVFYKQILENDVETMLTNVNIFNWAGAFGIQDPLQSSYITKIEGDRSNVLGLDKETLMRLTKNLGYK